MTPTKKQILEHFISKGNTHVVLQSQADGVCVPEYLKRDPYVTLLLGYDVAVPIPDLRIDDSGVTATLSFNRSPFLCAFPWDAVVAITDMDGRGIGWGFDDPGEEPPKRSHLRVVK
jgi:hypothetical protein